MPQDSVLLKVRIRRHERELLVALAEASNYTALNGRPDVGRVISDLLESEVERATWPKHRAHEEGYSSLQEAIEDHQHVARLSAKRNAKTRRRRRSDAMKTLRVISLDQKP